MRARCSCPGQAPLVLQCCPGLDRSVPGITSTIGGSVAGYARWEVFHRRGLMLYATRRNDAMQRDGVHWCMYMVLTCEPPVCLSPFWCAEPVRFRH